MNRVLASFTRSEKSIIAFVLALIAAGYGILDYQERQREVTVFQADDKVVAGDALAPVLPDGVEPDGLININTADKEVLETLPGVGPSMAEKIMQHRTLNGPMQSMADLDAVPGVGPAMMTKLAPLVSFGKPGDQISATPAAEITPKSVEPVPVLAMAAVAPLAPTPAGVGYPSLQAAASPPDVPSVQSASSTNRPVNINTAGIEELDTLSGIGPALSERIIIDRKALGPYRSVQDLMRVKGIGPAILRKNRGRIVVH